MKRGLLSTQSRYEKRRYASGQKNPETQRAISLAQRAPYGSNARLRFDHILLPQELYHSDVEAFGETGPRNPQTKPDVLFKLRGRRGC